MSEKEQGVDIKNIELGSNKELVPLYVCNKCGSTISSDLGGYTVHYMDPSNPDNGTIECDDCCPLSPASKMFAAAYNEEAAHHEEEISSQCEDSDDDLDWYMDDNPAHHHGYNCPCGSMDCRNYMATTTGRNYVEYDHSEECS